LPNDTEPIKNGGRRAGTDVEGAKGGQVTAVQELMATKPCAAASPFSVLHSSKQDGRLATGTYLFNQYS